MTDLAIAEPGILTRGADAAATALKRGRCARDFFVLKTTVAAAYRTLQRSKLDVSQFGEHHLVMRSPGRPLSSQQAVILALQRNAFGAREPEKSGLQIVPFPNDVISLVDLVLDPTPYPEEVSNCFSFLIPRATFDQLADDHGADRIVGLAVRPGIAAKDAIVLGISPHRWLMQRRVDVAKDLMLTTDSSLVEIALKCGFSDQSHFTKVFAEVTANTPRRWRQIQLN